MQGQPTSEREEVARFLQSLLLVLSQIRQGKKMDARDLAVIERGAAEINRHTFKNYKEVAKFLKHTRDAMLEVFARGYLEHMNTTPDKIILVEHTNEQRQVIGYTYELMEATPDPAKRIIVPGREH